MKHRSRLHEKRGCQQRNVWHWGVVTLCLLLGASCSTTRKLEEGQLLYTGVKKITIEAAEGVVLKGDKSSAIYSPMLFPPNNPLYSPYLRSPFSTGLWVYNWNLKKERGVKVWLYNRLAKKPVLLSDVNPELRVKVVENTAREYGHFGTKVRYELIHHKRNPKKVKLNYHLSIPAPYRLEEVTLGEWTPGLDTLMNRIFRQSLLQPGEEYNVGLMGEERDRITTALRNQGYYYFDPGYIEFQADSTFYPGKKIAMRMELKEGIPPMALRPYKIRRVDLLLGDQGKGDVQDSLCYKGLYINHYAPSGLRKWIAYDAILLRPGDVYMLRRQERTQTNLLRLGIFRYTNVELMPVDSSLHAPYGTLDMKISAVYDLPMEMEVEMDVSSKSNSLLGPGLALSLNHKNVFNGGESLTLRLNGSYEWQTQRPAGYTNMINSYAVGVGLDLSVPRLSIPRTWRGERFSSERTQFQLKAELMSRHTFFQMLSFSGSIAYNFQSGWRKSHSIMPLKLSYTYLLNTSELFDETIDAYPAIALSFRNQFIPSMSYTYTYDQRIRRATNNRFFWQGSVTSAGNILSGLYALTGNRQGQGKEIFGNVYSQFLKVNSQLILYRPMTEKSYLAARLMGGVGYAYGNSRVMPYSEQFYIGGANSIRAFTIRSIGPGDYRPAATNRMAYLDQTGDIKLEGNVEYRFGMTSQLLGAVFLDAGNTWLLRKDPERPGGEFRLKGLPRELALGTGFGVRYDISYLVLRGDIGIGLHTPYKNPDKPGYFNISGFRNRYSFHLAIGYPF